ncbi:MAG: hypothetical protein RL376_1442 [Verrucomicrobiota bacterium]
MPHPAKRVIEIQDAPVTVIGVGDADYISLTDMLRAKDGEFFISDWLRNRNTVEFLGIWEAVHNPAFNHGEFAIIRSQAGLNSYKLSVKKDASNWFTRHLWPLRRHLIASEIRHFRRDMIKVIGIAWIGAANWRSKKGKMKLFPALC